MTETMIDNLTWTLDRLDVLLHPRQRVGLRWYSWNLVNAFQCFLSFWGHCYVCGQLHGCACAPGPEDDRDPRDYPMDARTAWSVAWIIWKPRWDDRPYVRKPAAVRIAPASETATLLAKLEELHRGAEIGPWTVETGPEFSGRNWLLGSFGADDNANVYLTTDGVHASECSGEGALADAQFCAEARNLMPEVIAALRWRAVVERAREVKNVST